MSDRCVEVCARDCGLSEGGDVVATRRLTRSTSKEIQVCLHLLYFDLLERIERPLGIGYRVWLLTRTLRLWRLECGMGLGRGNLSIPGRKVVLDRYCVQTDPCST